MFIYIECQKGGFVDKHFRGRRKRPRVLLYSNWQEELLMDAIINEAGRFEWETMDSRFLHGDASDWHPDCQRLPPWWWDERMKASETQTRECSFEKFSDPLRILYSEGI